MRLRGRVSKLEAKNARGAAHKPSTIMIRSVVAKDGEQLTSQVLSALVLTANGCKTLQRETNETEDAFKGRIEVAGST